MRRAAKVDENQSDIVNGLMLFGAKVQLLHAVGQGCPDILVGFNGKNFLIEIKNPDKPKGDQKLTPDQVKWHKFWTGQKAIAHTLDEALQIINCNGTCKHQSA
jgi:hypothetical protein